MSEFFAGFLKKRRELALWSFCLTAFIGIFLFGSFVREPSELEQQFFLGLSLPRFVIASLFFLGLLANMGMIFFFLGRLGTWQLPLQKKIKPLVSNQIVLILSILSLLLLAVGALLLFLIPPTAISLSFLIPLRVRLLAPLIWLFLISSVLFFLIRLFFAEEARQQGFVRLLDKFLLLSVIFLCTFTLYEHIAAWIGWFNKTKYSYWNLLAGEFLQGRLYLSDPPQNTHDLTPYNGHWYVPSPPMPAVLMMPLAYLFGAERISTADFSMVFSALNATLVFLILEELMRRQWIRLTRVGALCLVLLFAFGTPHLWVGISGRFWFVSQILTVTFLCLAILAALRSWSPWVIGIFIGMAVATRPNGLMTWFFVFAIAMQIIREQQGQVDFRQMVGWSLRSWVPIAASVGALLLYNQARFENFLDFGYVTINGDVDIVESARTYGLFSLHYLPYNLRIMLLYLPRIDWANRWPILPSGAGMSIFLTTPSLIYLFRRYEFKWWIAGAWVSVFLNLILLLLYHNSGRDQFGYRYILDALVPLIALLGVGLGKKIPWHFILLLILSIAINLYGTHWFMNG